MRRIVVAWAEAALLFAALYAGVPLAGLALDGVLGLPGLPVPLRGAGIPVLGLGAAGLGWSFVTFARHGGTPNPIAPPTSLVTTGPFAWTRNPILVSHFFALLGATLLVGSVVGTILVFLLAVPGQALVRHEELVLEARFGAAYRAYRDRVPRWIPRRPRA